MDIVKEKWKKNLVVKTWNRCRSFGAGRGNNNSFTRSKSSNSPTKASDSGQQKNKCPVTPEGCFSVYVGPQKQRFVVKTEVANHPLFQTLLEDAELEYGYNSQGPILLPCQVDLFYKVLAEVDYCDELSPGCNFVCSPARLSIFRENKGHGEYRPLSPSPMVRMNQF